MNPCPCGLSGDESGRCTCRAEQIQRYRSRVSGPLLDSGEVEAFCPIRGESLRLLEQAVAQLYLSPRACHRALKVARTIADLDQAEDIACEHIAEAIALRKPCS